MKTKRCRKCLNELPLDAFYSHAQMKDGRLNKCKECTKKDTIQNRLAKIDYYRAYDRVRASAPHRVAAREEYAKTDAWRVSHAKAIRKMNERYPKRYTARNVLRAAVRDGKVSVLPCFVCGGKAEAHHPDYDRPLDVVWLCPPHHREAHAIARR